MSDFKFNGDPLDLARQELDFAGLAASAPSVKDILYKAQTMGPVAAPRRWDRTAGGAGAAAVALALIFVPWMPEYSRVEVTNMQFDQTFRPDQANYIVNQMVRGLPDDLLLGAEYSGLAGSEQPAAGEEIRGLLSLRVADYQPGGDTEKTIAGVLASQLETTEAPAISAEPPREEMVGRQSPAAWLAQRFSAPEEIKEFQRPAAELAAEVVDSEKLLATELQKALSGSYFELRSLTFLTPEATAPLRGEYFTVETWPWPLAVEIANYRHMSSLDQAQVQSMSREFLASMNLIDRELTIRDSAQDRPTILVSVYGADGQLDQLATERLQAWTKQPLFGEVGGAQLDVAASVADGIEQVLSDYICRVDYERVAGPAEGKVNYNVRVSIAGPRNADEKPRRDWHSSREGELKLDW